MAKIRLAILASGAGSNAEAIMKWSHSSGISEVVCVISDKKNAFVLERAKNNNVPAVFIKKNKNGTKESFDQEILDELKKYKPDWIILAGYMKILTPVFLNSFKDKIVNIHPSLLPLFPGVDGYGEAFRSEMSESGCTIHYVDEGIDTGKIIAQKRFPKIAGESFEDFKKRGLSYENQFYPEILEKIITGKV